MNTKTKSTNTLIPRCLFAFTLVELLATIAIIAILASVLLLVLNKAKLKGGQAVCLNNFHQLVVGFQLYEGDSNDQLPAPGSKDEYGPQPEDWIWWQHNRDINNSSIAQHIAGFNPILFTCPEDYSAKSLQGQGDLPGEPYRFSYSLTSYNLTTKNGKKVGHDGAGDIINPGMSTIITQNRQIYPFKASEIRNPSSKIMLVEEDRKTINDPRWLPSINPIAARHIGKGNVAFADGHLEPVSPQFGMNPTNSNPTL